MSQLEFLDNLQMTIDDRYKKLNYLQIQDEAYNYSVTIIIKTIDKDFFKIIWDPHNTRDRETRYFENIKYQNLTPVYIYELQEISEFVNFYFNIILSNQNDHLQIQIRDAMISQINEKNTHKKNCIFLTNFPPIIINHTNHKICSINLLYNDKIIFFNMIIKRKTDFLCFKIETENIWKKIIIKLICDSNCLDKNIELISLDIFKNFDFFLYGRIVDYINLDEKFSLFKLFDNDFIKGKIYTEQFSNFVVFLRNLNIFNRMRDEINDLGLFFKNLDMKDYKAIVLLFFSMPNEVKRTVINKILDADCCILESLLICFALCEHNYITKEERDFMCNLNLSYDHSNKSSIVEIFLKNNFYRHNLKAVLLNLKFDIICEINFLIIGVICKLLDDIFFHEKFKNVDYTWREQYEKIFEMLNIKKEKGNLLFLFKKIIIDPKKFDEIVNLKSNQVWVEFAKIIGVDICIQIDNRHFLYKTDLALNSNSNYSTNTKRLNWITYE